MNKTLETIKNRRSYRNFKSKQINEKYLKLILEAAIYAPSAMNQQKWHFTVIQNKELLKKMIAEIKNNMHNSPNDRINKMANNEDFNPFYNAPTVILVSGQETARWISLDCGLSMQNIVLAAESINIGTCIIAMSNLLFESKNSELIKNELALPNGYKHFCSIALGYKPDKQPSVPTKNKDVIDFIR